MHEDSSAWLAAEEAAVRERGLLPFRMHLTFYIETLRIRRGTPDTCFAVTCERRKRCAATEPINTGSDGENIVNGSSSFQVCHVVACLGVLSDLPEGEPNAGYSFDKKLRSISEPIIARIAIRRESKHGNILDWTVHDLGDFFSGNKKVSTVNLELQYGSLLRVRVEACICEDAHPLDGGVRSVSHSASMRDEWDSGSRSKPNTSERDCKDAIGIEKNPKDEQENCSITEDIYYLSAGKEQRLDGARSTLGRDVETNSEPKLNEAECADVNERVCRHSTHLSSSAAEPDLANENICEVIDNSKGETADRELSCKAIKREQCPELYSTPCAGGIWSERPILVEIDAPVKLVSWTINGPPEDNANNNEDEMVDVGDGVMAPKRDIEQLRASMVVSCTTPGPPAKTGKLSILQKAILIPKKPAPPCVINLGGPVSLVRSTVLATTRILGYDVKYVDEPMLSDSDSEESCQDYEDEEEKDETEDGLSSLASSRSATQSSSANGEVQETDSQRSEQVTISQSSTGESLGTAADNALTKTDSSPASFSVTADGNNIKQFRIRSGFEDAGECNDRQSAKKGALFEHPQVELKRLQFENHALGSKVPELGIGCESCRSKGTSLAPYEQSMLGVENDEILQGGSQRAFESTSKDDLGPFSALQLKQAELNFWLRTSQEEQRRSHELELEIERLLNVVLALTRELDRAEEAAKLNRRVVELERQLADSELKRSALEANLMKKLKSSGNREKQPWRTRGKKKNGLMQGSFS